MNPMIAQTAVLTMTTMAFAATALTATPWMTAMITPNLLILAPLRFAMGMLTRTAMMLQTAMTATAQAPAHARHALILMTAMRTRAFQMLPALELPLTSTANTQMQYALQTATAVFLCANSLAQKEGSCQTMTASHAQSQYQERTTCTTCLPILLQQAQLLFMLTHQTMSMSLKKNTNHSQQAWLMPCL
jgi:hypothetical protein